MDEYYYTDELTHAAAAVKHGFEGVEHGLEAALTGHFWHGGFRPGCTLHRFPLTPHNVALMTALQKGDVIIHLLAEIAAFMDDVMMEEIEDHNKALRDGEISIIARPLGGKPFPFPQFTKIGEHHG